MYRRGSIYTHSGGSYCVADLYEGLNGEAPWGFMGHAGSSSCEGVEHFRLDAYARADRDFGGRIGGGTIYGPDYTWGRGGDGQGGYGSGYGPGYGNGQNGYGGRTDIIRTGGVTTRNCYPNPALPKKGAN